MILDDKGVHVTVDRITGGFLVTVGLRATVYGACHRCLCEVVVAIETEQQEFVPTHPEKWDEADLSPFIEDFVVDIAGLAREALVLALPAKILCREECPGLCPQCGGDLGGDDDAPVTNRASTHAGKRCAASGRARVKAPTEPVRALPLENRRRLGYNLRALLDEHEDEERILSWPFRRRRPRRRAGTSAGPRTRSRLRP